MNSSSGGNSSSGNSSAEFVFGEFVCGIRLRNSSSGGIRLRGEFVWGMRLRNIRLRGGIRLREGIRLRGIRLRNSSSGGKIRLGEIRLRNSSSGGIRLRGAIRLPGTTLPNSSLEFVFVCGWKSDTRTAATMYVNWLGAQILLGNLKFNIFYFSVYFSRFFAMLNLRYSFLFQYFLHIFGELRLYVFLCCDQYVTLFGHFYHWTEREGMTFFGGS